MSVTDPLVLLGPEARQVLEAVHDEGLKMRIFRAVAVCEEGLAAVDALDLTEYETLERTERDLAVWDAVAPDVRQLLVAAGRAGATLKELFPTSDLSEETLSSLDLDAALTLLEDDGPPEPIRDAREREIDEIVEQTRDVPMAIGGVCRLAMMLQSDFLAFGQRLRNPAVVTDHWLLLAELQELKSKSEQALEAVVASLVSPFTNRPLEEILPRYATATARAVMLREKLVDLAHDVARLNDKLQRCDSDQAVAVRHALSARLNEFVEHEAYRYLRPADKREFSTFRIGLAAYEDGVWRLGELRTLVEGFATFLDVLRAINHRDQLVQHDEKKLQTAVMLAEAEAEDSEVFDVLRWVYGRDRTLDRYIRSLRRGEPVDRAELEMCIQAAIQVVASVA